MMTTKRNECSESEGDREASRRRRLVMRAMALEVTAAETSGLNLPREVRNSGASAGSACDVHLFAGDLLESGGEELWFVAHHKAQKRS